MSSLNRREFREGNPRSLGGGRRRFRFSRSTSPADGGPGAGAAQHGAALARHRAAGPAHRRTRLAIACSKRWPSAFGRARRIRSSSAP